MNMKSFGIYPHSSKFSEIDGFCAVVQDFLKKDQNTQAL